MARGVDPRGDWTVVIITKCDVVQSGDEAGAGACLITKCGVVQSGDEAGVGACLSWSVLALISVRSSTLHKILSKSCSMDGLPFGIVLLLRSSQASL